MEKYIGLLKEWKSDSRDPTLFYFEKSQMLALVLLMQRDVVARPTDSSEEKTREYLDRIYRKNPRAEIAGRDRVMTALLEFFESEAAVQVFERRRLLWFQPVRARLGPGLSYSSSNDARQMAILFTSGRSPVLAVYGRLAMLLDAAKN